MKPGKGSCGRIAIMSCIVLFSGCIVPNKEIVQLRSDVDELKKENIRLKQAAGITPQQGRSRIDDIERELASVKTDLGKEISFIGRELKNSKASSTANLDSIRADFQALTGRFEEARHLSDKVSNANKAFIDTADDRLTSIETRLKKLEEEIATQSAALAALGESAADMGGESLKKPEISAKELYKSALDLIRSGKTKEARDLFNRYLRDYPGGALANNAQFWIGESYYDEKEYEKAIVEYEEVMSKYPAGGKVPAAMLKQAMAFEKIRDYKTSLALYDKLIKAHPKSDEAGLARKFKARRKKKKK